MSRTRSFFGGAIFAYLYQACSMVIGLWLTPFYLRTLGSNDYGIWLIGMQVLVFLLLCDFGVLAVVPRDVARAHGKEQSEAGSGELPMLIGQTIKVVGVQTLLVALVSFGVFFFRPPTTAAIRGPITLALFVFVLTFPMRLFPAVLQGLQDLKFLGQLRLWMWAVSTAVSVVLLILGARFWALACGWSLQQIVHDLVAFRRLRRVRPDLLTAAVLKSTGPFTWRWFLRGLWVNVGQIGYGLSAGTDLMIIGRALGPATVVVYSCTVKLITVLQNQPQILASVALPGLSHLKASEPRQQVLHKTISLTQAMLVLIGGVFCIVLTVNQQFVMVWLGPKFFGGIELTYILLLNFLVRQIDYTLSMALFAFGYEKPLTIRTLLDGIVSFGLALVLVRHFGLVGVAIGTLCGGLCVALPTDVFLYMREFKLSFFGLLRPYAPYLWRFAVVGIAGLAFAAQFHAPNFFNLAMITTFVVLAYSLLVLPYAWRTPLRGYVEMTISAMRSAMPTRILGWSNNG
jgi:O-antigen/teichoic acid export membrane protein